jgi:hypothetical protein
MLPLHQHLIAARHLSGTNERTQASSVEQPTSWPRIAVNRPLKEMPSPPVSAIEGLRVPAITLSQLRVVLTAPAFDVGLGLHTAYSG